MAAEKDQSGWLPTPPPPRPARREAAIDAALRRFDGEEEAASPATEKPRRSWASTHRPQLAMAFSALLLVVIGVPAALIGIRNQPPAPERAPSAIGVRDTAPAAPAAPNAANAPAAARADIDEVGATPAPPAPASPPAESATEDASVAVSAEPATANAPAPAVAAPPPSTPPPAAQIAAAAPPPPPPAPPAARAERGSEVMADNVIVTGTRIQSPALAAPQGFQAKTAERRPAADPAYSVFLSRLQAAVRSGDHRAMIALIAFPLRVNTRGGARVYRDARSVERNFDRIFTSRVQQAILRQRPERLFVRDQGATVGNGEIWFDRTCANPSCSPLGPVRITAVNP